MDIDMYFKKNLKQGFKCFDRSKNNLI